MAEAKTKKYRIELPYYRKGVLYPPGTVVEIPADEKPSVTWKPYVEEEPGTEKAKGKPQGRPSEKDVI